jgi:hypothetical protein
MDTLVLVQLTLQDSAIKQSKKNKKTPFLSHLKLFVSLNIYDPYVSSFFPWIIFFPLHFKE